MRAPARRSALMFATVLATIEGLAPSGVAEAQLGVGTWVWKGGEKAPVVMTMTVEACCSGGRRLTYRTAGAEGVVVVESGFDGKEAPVLVDGKPSGQTMAITRVDSHHTSTVIKMQGKLYGTSRSALSADGGTLTVESEEAPGPDGAPGVRSTQTWVKQ